MFETLFSIPTGLIIIFGLRLLVPLTIFRWPLWGGLASLAIDALDVEITKPLGVHIPNYILTDKYLDTYYLTIELIVSLRWINKLAKNTSILLYFWRFLGVLAFQLSGEERWLFFTPNLFEYFFLFFVIMQMLGKETSTKSWLNSPKRLVTVLFLLLISKMPQEFVLHLHKVSYSFGTIIERIKELILLGS